mgnify:CR=1 FL=1
MSDNKIKCGDGGFYAVTAAGHIISAKAIKPGMRWATADDLAAATAAEAKRAAAEAKLAAPTGGPLKGS